VTFENISLLNVSFVRGNEKLAMGRLAFKNRKILFEYDPQFIQIGLELSPFHLPAYDLSFSSGSYGEHCTMVMGEGRDPSVSHLLKLAEVGGISKEQALIVIDEVRQAVLRWPHFSKLAGVLPTSSKLIQRALDGLTEPIR
jgi:hypothetical protein